jgi:predicted GIY-YIG superfamily endonuclease
MEFNYQVYGLIDPRDNKVKYIGISKNVKLRYQNHKGLSCHQKTLKDKWIQHLSSLNLTPKISILDSVKKTKSDAKKREQELIKFYAKKNIIYNISHNSFYKGAWLVINNELVKNHKLYKTIKKSIEL